MAFVDWAFRLVSQIEEVAFLPLELRQSLVLQVGRRFWSLRRQLAFSFRALASELPLEERAWPLLELVWLLVLVVGSASCSSCPTLVFAAEQREE